MRLLDCAGRWTRYLIFFLLLLSVFATFDIYLLIPCSLFMHAALDDPYASNLYADTPPRVMVLIMNTRIMDADTSHMEYRISNIAAGPLYVPSIRFVSPAPFSVRLSFPRLPPRPTIILLRPA